MLTVDAEGRISKGPYYWIYIVLYLLMIVLVILVQVFQSVGNYIVKKTDKRIR